MITSLDSFVRLGIRTTTGVALIVVAACVDSPTAAPASQDENLLAGSFDQLSAEQIALGDIERGEELRWTALALREGAEPTRVEVLNGGSPQVFNTLVQAARWSSPSFALRPETYRAVVGWRKAGDTLHVVLIASSGDQAQVTYPVSLRPSLPGGILSLPEPRAHAAYFERGSGNAEWFGTSGSVTLSERQSAGICERPSTTTIPPAGITCSLTTFLAGLDITFQRAAQNSAQLEDGGPTRRVTMHDQTVAGVKLIFGCVSPKSDVGCQ